MSAGRLCAGIACAAALAATPACDAKRADPHADHMASAAPDAHATHAMHAMDPPAAAPSGAHALRVEAPAAVVAGQPAGLEIRLMDAFGEPVRDLRIVHEKKLHFLVMSRDLAFFSHEHPTDQGEGLLTLPFTFPAPGEYVFFADYTPDGAAQVISTARLTVPGASKMTAPDLTLDDLSHARRFGDYDVALEQTVEDSGTLLTFRITKGGSPIRDLQPFLGAHGHLVLVDPDATTLLHSHPLGAGEPGEVAFHTSLPPNSRFKLWAEFRPEGKPLRADFVIASAARASRPALHAH